MPKTHPAHLRRDGRRPPKANPAIARIHSPGPSVDSQTRGVTVAAEILLLVFLALGSSPAALAWGRKVKLARSYHPGRSMVYQTNMETHATVRSNPSGLKSFLPPLPTDMTTRQQNTVTVRAVHREGTADVETRFDQFEFHSDLTDRLPEKERSSTQQAEQDFSKRVVGQTLTAHYDREGQLLSFDGGDDMLKQVDAPLREPLRQILRLFLEQMGGSALYPDHAVKPGDEWKKKTSSPATDQLPFAMEGENTMRYVGRTRYRGVKAAIVDYRFSNLLKPAFSNLGQMGPLAPLEAMGVGLDLGINGQGQGRVLLALDDGRLLQNRSNIRQTLRASLKSPPQRSSASSAEPLTLQVESETTLEVDSAR